MDSLYLVCATNLGTMAYIPHLFVGTFWNNFGAIWYKLAEPFVISLYCFGRLFIKESVKEDLFPSEILDVTNLSNFS